MRRGESTSSDQQRQQQAGKKGKAKAQAVID